MELERVHKEGLSVVPAILDELMKEDAFYDRLREGFNDIFLTLGYDDGAESALSYDHFSTTRHWTPSSRRNRVIPACRWVWPTSPLSCSRSF